MAGEFFSELHQAAVEYATGGFAIFICEPNSKVPATANGFKDATNDIETINHWYSINPNYNIAIEPERSGLAVIDIEHDGIPQLKQFCNGHGPLPRTFANKTPRGGEHRFYSGSVQSLVRPFKGFELDTRGRGGYVLLPPSRTPDGTYETIDDGEITEFPSWVSERIAERKRDKQNAIDNLQIDSEDNKRRAREWFEKQSVPVQGERNHTTFKAACRMKDLGASPQTIFDMLKTWAQEDFDEDEIYGRVVSAFENGQNAPGNDAVQSSADAFGHMALDKIAAANASAKVEIIDRPIPFSQFVEREEKPVAWLIPGILEKGEAIMFAGPGGTHKSRTAVHWGCAVSAGIPVYEQPTEQARFVFLSYEDDPDEVLRRSKAIAKKLECQWSEHADYWDKTENPEPLAIVSDTDGIQTTSFYERFRAYLKSTPGHKLVAIDSTYNALFFVGQAKVSEPAVYAAISFLRRLARETDSTIIFLWHPSQAGVERGDASGWSVAWHNAPRCRLSISEAKGADAFELKVEKTRHGRKGVVATLHWDNGLLSPLVGLNATALFEACVQIATESALLGNPIKNRQEIIGWQVDEIERACGFRPSQQQIKTELANAIPAKRLRYVRGHGKTRAGYFPFEAEFLPDGEMIIPSTVPPDEREPNDA